MHRPHRSHFQNICREKRKKKRLNLKNKRNDLGKPDLVLELVACLVPNLARSSLVLLLTWQHLPSTMRASNHLALGLPLAHTEWVLALALLALALGKRCKR